MASIEYLPVVATPFGDGMAAGVRFANSRLLRAAPTDAANLVLPELPGQPAADGGVTPAPELECDRIRILMYGSPRAIRHTIHQLHLLRFVEQFRWNSIRAIPENGIHITPAEAEAYTFLLKELRIG